MIKSNQIKTVYAFVFQPSADGASASSGGGVGGAGAGGESDYKSNIPFRYDFEKKKNEKFPHFPHRTHIK